ncbi:outer dynein arm-docking complex subunit 3 [Frieseomelitta varia]|uniref:outer dynein arm-docking complex subunit 3 n=1 Tax=Frieseomelitta varia TaxID=561572 RepID=UPI001CB6AD06|nr:outer dynein arm-docking complex subunit 3 [Frieseomelitta varia]
MSDPLAPIVENKLNDLNKKIAEIKKKIQLSEGQRKANFEEYEAKKHEYAKKIAALKQSIKELYMEYANVQNNEGKSESKIRMSRKSSAREKKRNLGEAINKMQEDNVRLRKKHDLIKYQRKKRQQKLHSLLDEYGKLMNNKMQKIFKRKTENPSRNKIVKLEVLLEHIRMMQIKANIARMKYRSMCSDLKQRSVLYVSSLKNLEDEIKEQESEIKRLQSVKEEAIALKDHMQETLIKEEIEVTNCSRERYAVLEEYRQRVLERKMELERLEKMIFQSRPRDDFDTRGKGHVQVTEDISNDEVTRLEETFAKLRSATGVSRSEDVLNRFLGQRATKDNLQKMRVATEQEKMALEKQRLQLIDEMETRKFSETKDAEQNAEETEKLNQLIERHRSRQLKADTKRQKVEELLQEITTTLWNVCNKFRDVVDTLPKDPKEIQQPLQLIDLMNERATSIIETLGGPDKYLEVLDEISVDKLETVSITTTSVEGKAARTNGGPLFPRFPSSATQATMPSEDEEDVPTRNTLKKQAQQLVDIKSRRKGFTFKR